MPVCGNTWRMSGDRLGRISTLSATWAPTSDLRRLRYRNAFAISRWQVVAGLLLLKPGPWCAIPSPCGDGDRRHTLTAGQCVCRYSSSTFAVPRASCAGTRQDLMLGSRLERDAKPSAQLVSHTFPQAVEHVLQGYAVQRVVAALTPRRHPAGRFRCGFDSAFLTRIRFPPRPAVE